jgi:hypothetical protein
MSVLLWYITSLGDWLIKFLDNMVVEVYKNTFWLWKMRALNFLETLGNQLPSDTVSYPRRTDASMTVV